MSDRIPSENKNPTLVNLLHDRASQHPDQVVYTFKMESVRVIGSISKAVQGKSGLVPAVARWVIERSNA